ncbi:MAG: hypothetical protein ACI4MG_10935 [Aristaeellaceae bacterium]
MPYTIRVSEVRRVLQPVLGLRFVTETSLCDHVAEILRGYRPARETPQMLQRQLKERIFSDLYALLGQQMLLRMENGVVRRILLRDVDFMVDECWGVLLDAMPPQELSLEGLRESAMTQGSLSAMRVLLERFGDQLPDLEREMLRRIIRENHPMSGWRNG